jgi:hypothetical protein
MAKKKPRVASLPCFAVVSFMALLCPPAAPMTMSFF